MILTVATRVPNYFAMAATEIEILDSEIRDPAVGVIGHALGKARIRGRGGEQWLEVTIEVDDDSAIAAATRNGGPF